MTLCGAMALLKYHSENKAMKRVQVWLVKVKVTRKKRKGGIRVFDDRYMYLPPEEEYLGECEGSPEALAALAGVDVCYAGLALKRMEECWWVFEEDLGSESFAYYLLVSPAEKKRGCPT